MRQSLRTASVFGLGAALVAAMGACSSGGGAPAVDTGAVTLTVADRPGADQAANRTYFDAQVAAFQKANPNVSELIEFSASDITAVLGNSWSDPKI